MVATTFILTRAFAISALFVGAFQYGAEAAPVPAPVSTAAAPRWETLGRRSLIDTVIAFTSGGGRRNGVHRAPDRVAKAAAPPPPEAGPTFAFWSQAPVSFVKRGCRQQGCLDRRAAYDARGETISDDASPQTSRDMPRPEAHRRLSAGTVLSRFLPSSPPPPLDIANANVARSCRQVGCLRDTDGGDAGLSVPSSTANLVGVSSPDVTLSEDVSFAVESSASDGGQQEGPVV
ncbi:hypothetical protein FKP32DRAFT_847202 [Trametes sanguinea]|nr:hypothetical protein FKP32DRAFT_847202 [Trametes sanguinea]